MEELNWIYWRNEIKQIVHENEEEIKIFHSIHFSNRRDLLRRRNDISDKAHYHQHQCHYHRCYRRPPVDTSDKETERTIFLRKTKRGREKVRDGEGRRQRERRKRRRRSAQTPGVPTSLPLEPASKTPPCRHPGEIAVWRGQPRFPALATSAPGSGWPSQDRNIMPKGSSFHPARVYRVLRASFSHSVDAFASFRAPRVSGAPVSRTQVFRARAPHARGNVPLSLSPNLHFAARTSLCIRNAPVEFCLDNSPLEGSSRACERGKIPPGRVARPSVASFLAAISLAGESA